MSLLAVLTIMVLLCTGLIRIPSPERRALPWFASNVHEFRWNGGINGDYSSCLKARISQTEFRTFVDRLGLDRVYSEKDHSELNVFWVGPEMGADSQADWWDPPTSLEGSHFKHVIRDEYFEIAKYHNGHVYSSVLQW